jgi:hypothetical protein
MWPIHKQMRGEQGGGAAKKQGLLQDSTPRVAKCDSTGFLT